jgi:ornithine carbamoyltransferase
MPKHLTKMSDLSMPELSSIVARARDFQTRAKEGVRTENMLQGRVVAMVFEKPSLRTKVSFEVATMYLGGNPVFLSSDQIFASGGNQRGRESLPDIARNLERFCDLIVARVFSHATIETLASISKVPVVNALCDMHHPCQAIADVMTMERRFGDVLYRPLRVAYIGDGNNVATSLLQACAMRGHHVSIATPPGYEVPAQQCEVARRLCRDTNQELSFLRSPEEAVRMADVVYTDTFISMGQEEETAQRLKDFAGYQVNSNLMSKAPPTAVFMHCLPAHRGEEVTDEVMDSVQSIVFDQAECRLHVAKAVLCWSLGLL